MACEDIRRTLLDFGWDRSQRERARGALEHLARCDACRAATEEFDRVRSVLRPEEETVPAPSGGWPEFEKRLLARSSRQPRRRWLPLLAAAASVLVGVAVGWETHRRRGSVREDRVLLSEKSLSRTEIRESRAAFEEISEVFEGHAGWMLLSDGSSDMGVASTALEAGRKLLILRLTVVSEGKVVSKADLVIVPGQTAEPVLAFVGNKQLRYTIRAGGGSQGDDLSIGVAIVGSHEKEETVASLWTMLATSEEKVLPAGQLVTADGKYELSVGLSWTRM